MSSKIDLKENSTAKIPFQFNWTNTSLLVLLVVTIIDPHIIVAIFLFCFCCEATHDYFLASRLKTYVKGAYQKKKKKTYVKGQIDSLHQLLIVSPLII